MAFFFSIWSSGIFFLHISLFPKLLLVSGILTGLFHSRPTAYIILPLSGYRAIAYLHVQLL